MKRGCEKSGVKRIRLHDIRHSHCALLYELGIPPLEIAERLGYERVETTMQVYAHLYPNKQEKLSAKLQKVREATPDYSYGNDYQVMSKLKEFADCHGICLLLVHHTRKQKSDDNFDTISGTNGLFGGADGAFILYKDKRTSSAATLEISGRDQQEQKLILAKNPDTLYRKLNGLHPKPFECHLS